MSKKGEGRRNCRPAAAKNEMDERGKQGNIGDLGKIGSFHSAYRRGREVLARREKKKGNRILSFTPSGEKGRGSVHGRSRRGEVHFKYPLRPIEGRRRFCQEKKKKRKRGPRRSLT